MPKVTCHECGQSWGEEATFCGACGGRLPGRPEGQTAEADRSTGSDGRRRWLVAAIVAAIAMFGAGAATLTRSSTSEGVATGGGDVVVPDRGQLQDLEGGQQTRGPEVTCEREGEPVDCVAWMHRLVSASSAPDRDWWRVEVASDGILARSAETIVALSRTSGQVAWRKDFDAGAGWAGGPWVVGDKVMVVRTGEKVRALSLVDGSEPWSVDDARVAVPVRGDQPGTIYTVQLDDGRSLLAAHGADGTVRWRHTVAEVDPATRTEGRRHRQGPVPVEVTEAGPLAFVAVQDDRVDELHTVALDRDDGTERWQRADSRPLHASGDVAVVLDLDVDVHEQDDSISVSESPAALVGLDATEGTARWRREPAGEHLQLGIVDNVLVTLEDDGLTGIDVATGEDLWHNDVAEDEHLINADARWGPSFSEHRTVISFVSPDRRVMARDPATGEILWQTQLDQFVGRVSTVDDAIVADRSGSRLDDGDRVYVTTFIQLDPATGHVRGTITTESDGLPELVDRDVLVDPEAGWVVRIDLSES